MTAVLKQASNNTGLSLARELTPSVVDGSVTWFTQEPNTYKDFGGQYKMVARMPINSARQNKKGVITDLDVSGGWDEDITMEGVQNKIEGLMYAAFRKKAEIAVTAVNAGADQFTVAAGGTAVKAGDILFASGFAHAANNGVHIAASSGATEITVVDETLVNDTTGKIVVVGHQAVNNDVAYVAASKSLTSTTLDFTTLNLNVGEYVCCVDDNAQYCLTSNLGMARIFSIAAHVIVFDKVYAANVATAIIDAAATTEVAPRFYFGRIVKNELASLIEHYTYQAERTLGNDDTTATMAQAEYLTGGVINEAVFTFNTADKATCEWTLLAARYETRTSTEGPKPGTRASAAETSAFNTSTDVKFMSLELANVDMPLYAYLMDLAITVKNNAKANKAVGVLGAIDMTEGQFEVSAAATAYFSNVGAAQAIEQNSDVTLAAFLARDNHGMLFDLPLISLSDGRPKITANEAIQLPLTINAATASSLNPNADYTMMVMFFDYLPTLIAA